MNTKIKFIVASILLVVILVLAIVLVLISGSNQSASISEEEKNFYTDLQKITLKDEVTEVESVETIMSEGNYSTGAKSILSTVYNDVYLVLDCEINGVPENVLMLTALNSEMAGRDNFINAKKSIRDWEPLMAKDLAHILYKEADIGAVGSFDFTTFTFDSPHVASDEYRMAQVFFGSTNTNLYYAWTLNYVFFARSKNCLEATMATVYHVH